MAKFCSNCGKPVSESSNFCGACGFRLLRQETAQPVRYQQEHRLRCSRCGGCNINIQTAQENLGYTTLDASKTKYRPHYIQKRAIVKKQKGAEITNNRIAYRTIFTCLDCGNTWSNYANGNKYGYSTPT